MLLNGRNPSPFQSGPETEGQADGFSTEFFREKDLFMIYIYALVGFPVYITHRFKSGVIAGSCVAEIENPHNSLPFPSVRDLHIPVHPEIPVPSGPAVPGMYGIPACKIGGNLGVHHSLQIFANRKRFQVLHISISVIFHLCNSSVQFPVC